MDPPRLLEMRERHEDPWADPGTHENSPAHFMEDLCLPFGGYVRFFRMLLLHSLAWWTAVVMLPWLFLDHSCEERLPFAWFVYGACWSVLLMTAASLELYVVLRLGLLKTRDVARLFFDRHWQLPLWSGLLWRCDVYSDVVFIFVARDCGSSLWWASLATFFFGVFGQLLCNSCFACTDCDHELPSCFGFMLLDFKLLNHAISHSLPFDPDGTELPVGRPMTLRSASHLVGMEKLVVDIAQISIQAAFLQSASHGFVVLSVVVGGMHAAVSLATFLGAQCGEAKGLGRLLGADVEPHVVGRAVA
mmetsp:Transcript_7388/g.20237  ORF Transcript_7388/g.20237 Transcript_7388/m.20237 type:complete len:304 (-) Transcript_7388:31-942(-)